MTKIFFDLYELICSLLGFLLLFAINRKNVLAKPCSVKYRFYVFAFVLYIILILHITGAGTLSEWFVYPFMFSEQQINLIPFVSDMRFYVFAFVLYIILILHITGAGTLSEWFVYPFMFSEQQINLIPFVSDMINPLVNPQSLIDFVFLIVNSILESFLNTALFIPLGVFLCILWGVHNGYLAARIPQSLIDFVFLIVNSILESFLNTALFIPLGVFLCILWGVHNGYLAARIGFFFSLIIELSQLLNARVTDVDDLFFNTLGTVLGLVILKHVMKQNLQISKIVLFEGKDPSIWIIAIFLGRFFLFDEIGLAKILNLV